jgi:tetratricopeptide (TPR) repeat protein
MLRIVLLCACLAVASSPSFSREMASTDDVARAAELLQSWRGDSRILDDARTILTRELQVNPDSAPALREQARLLMLEGYLIGTTYKPENLSAAAKSLDTAIALAPKDPVAFLLRARIYTNIERFDDAWAALETARKTGADEREWLLVHASLLIRQQRFDEAAVSLGRVLKHPGITPGQRLEARYGMIRTLLVDLKVDQAEKVYRDQLKDTPEDAWTHGNYASFLLCWRDDFDASLAQVRESRRLLDYGNAQAVEMAALFRLWAQQILDGNAADAEITWEKTGADRDAGIAPFVSDLCGDNRVTYAVLKAMLRGGYGARVPALLAPTVAADKAPDKVPGVFVLNVQATGRSKGDLFLNSETDYRDPRNLSVRILPKAQEELRKKYGDDFEAALKGKSIEVMGWAARTKIIFRANGVDTGKFYYQTHVIMHSADQIQRLEDNPPRPDQRKKLDDKDVEA